MVKVTLGDGRHWDAELVSVGGRDLRTVWLVVDGTDVLLPTAMIREIEHDDLQQVADRLKS
jgi:hypothetical protein